MPMKIRPKMAAAVAASAQMPEIVEVRSLWPSMALAGKSCEEPARQPLKRIFGKRKEQAPADEAAAELLQEVVELGC